MRKCDSKMEASIGFFLEIKPKLTLRNSLKDKIDDITTLLDVDDEDTKLLMEETISGYTVTQEIVIPAFDINQKVFGSGNGEERIITTVYEIRTSPTHASTLKRILYNISHSNNYPIVQFIPYGIQDITNKDIYKKIFGKNAFIKDKSIIPVHDDDVDEHEIEKKSKLIENTKCIHSTKLTT